MKITGTVVDIDDNTPLDGAIIATTYDSTLSDDTGYFELETDELDSPVVIMRTGYRTITIAPEDTSIRENFESGIDTVTWSTIPMTDEGQELVEVEIIADRPPKKSSSWLGLLVLAAGIIGSTKD